jgi:hypothetical protein
VTKQQAYDCEHLSTSTSIVGHCYVGLDEVSLTRAFTRYLDNQMTNIVPHRDRRRGTKVESIKLQSRLTRLILPIVSFACLPV